MRTAIISGTFDPVTVGHLDIIRRAGALFDHVVVAVSANTEKNTLVPDFVRKKAIQAAVSCQSNVLVELCEGLLAEFCKKYENAVLVRGARNGTDFDYERQLFIINKGLGVEESIVLPADSGLDHISSTYVRELIKYKKDLTGAVPEGARQVIEEWLRENR